LHKLLDFLVRRKHWFLFVLLEFIALTLVFSYNDYQRSIYLSSANTVTGSILSVSGKAVSYLNLREINEDLMRRNGQLEAQVSELKINLERLTPTLAGVEDLAGDSIASGQFEFIQAKVVNNSVTRLSNYITINKGRKDGIMPDMGVLSESGAVGIVSNVSDHYAVVISLLNPKLRLSSTIKGNSYFGSLHWDGRDSRYSILEEVPRHVNFSEGDTVVTSGFSAVFPAGIMIGAISGSKQRDNDNFHSIQVRLSSDFYALNNVLVVKNNYQEEQHQAEREARRNDP